MFEAIGLETVLWANVPPTLNAAIVANVSIVRPIFIVVLLLLSEPVAELAKLRSLGSNSESKGRRPGIAPDSFGLKAFSTLVGACCS